MRRITFDHDCTALLFGQQKLNLHLAGAELEPHAVRPVPGTADLCFLVDGPISEAIEFFRREGVEIELGPVEQTGAAGIMDSIYLRDPDENLIELASYR
jgi:catechol 2,3-dioxygenase-like lactoylglutathione lyase family enzyme